MSRVTRLFPVFTVLDLDEAVAYYRDKLGFVVSWTWGEPVSRAGVTLDDVEIQLEGAGLGAPPGPSVVYCHMTDVDAYYEACRSRGATIAMEIGDRPWGMRDFRVIDPSGNRIGFGATPQKEPGCEPDREISTVSDPSGFDRATEFLDAVLEAWERSNAVLINLVGLVPAGGLNARAGAGSPTVAEMLSHVNHERLCSLQENFPDLCVVLPAREWDAETDPERITQVLLESGRLVREAVRERVQSGQPLAQDFAHPLHLIPFLIFHEGYHHGQIKLALKTAGTPVPDEEAGPLTWGVWRERTPRR